MEFSDIPTMTWVIIIGAAVTVVALAGLPGSIARGKKHHNAQAIHICGLIGILFFPCWFVAIVWALTAPKPPQNHYRDYNYHHDQHQR